MENTQNTNTTNEVKSEVSTDDIMSLFGIDFMKTIEENKDELRGMIEKLNLKEKLILSLALTPYEMIEELATKESETKTEQQADIKTDIKEDKKLDQLVPNLEYRSNARWNSKDKSEFIAKNPNYSYIIGFVKNYTNERMWQPIKSLQDFNIIMDKASQSVKPKVMVKILNAFRHGQNTDGTFDMNLVYNLLSDIEEAYEVRSWISDYYDMSNRASMKPANDNNDDE